MQMRDQGFSKCLSGKESTCSSGGLGAESVPDQEDLLEKEMAMHSVSLDNPRDKESGDDSQGPIESDMTE